MSAQKTILIVDDEVEMRIAMSGYLRGFESLRCSVRDVCRIDEFLGRHIDKGWIADIIISVGVGQALSIDKHLNFVRNGFLAAIRQLVVQSRNHDMHDTRRRRWHGADRRLTEAPTDWLTAHSCI